MKLRLLIVIGIATTVVWADAAVSSVLLVGFTVLLVLHYLKERRAVHRFVEEATAGCSDHMEQVLAIASAVFRIPYVGDPIFVPVPFLAGLGASPGAILQFGGCCSGKSRLTIVALKALHITAHQITLYHVSGRAHHAVVEVMLPSGPFVVDPTYGFHYADKGGVPVGTSYLRTGQRPEFNPISMTQVHGYPVNDYYNFAYAASKTANWTKTRCRRASYYVLRHLTAGQIDRIGQPWFLEWPQLLLSMALAAIVTAYLAILR